MCFCEKVSIKRVIEIFMPVFPLHNSDLQVLHNIPTMLTLSHVGAQPFRKPVNGKMYISDAKGEDKNYPAS